MIRIRDGFPETVGQLRPGPVPEVSSWTGTVTGLWQIPVRYDCRASSVDQARLVIARMASCDPGQVADLARTCPVFGRPEAGDPR
ncbi:hypothetical protein [Microlunatus ginsengisoli]|uniref:Uncharacterized protein n=1 Tax=Microlunatus ginsengisoli TaxID=363863 RepID=A0ABP6ZI82_9ACTN